MLGRCYADNGKDLSGGRRQLVGLFCAYFNYSEYMILDEPSVALDPISECDSNKLILSESNKTTTIIISHRLTTVKQADLIIVMDNGKIAEQGTHYDLIKKEGLYYEMYNRQSREYIE